MFRRKSPTHLGLDKLQLPPPTFKWCFSSPLSYNAATTARAAPTTPIIEPALATAPPDGLVVMPPVDVGATGVPTVGADVPFVIAIEVAIVTPAELV